MAQERTASMENQIERPLENPAHTASPLSTAPMQGQGSSPSRAAIEALFRHRAALLWTVGTVFGVTLLYVLLVPRTYQSEMNILVRNARPEYLLSPERNNGSTPLPEVTEEKINSEIEVLKSKDVADTVVDSNWPAKPLGERTAAEMRAHEKSVLFYGHHLNVESLRKSNVIHVTYTARSPREATETVEHLLDAFLAKQREIEHSTGASSFFATEAKRYKAELDDAQQQLAGYQQRNQIVSLPEKEATIENQIAQLEDQIRATQVAITEASSRVSGGQGQLRTMPARESTSERLIPNTYTVEQLTTLLANLQNQRTAALVKFLPTDRMVVELDKQIADTSAALHTAADARATENTTDVNPVYQQVSSSVAQATTELRALNGRLADQNEQLARLKNFLIGVEGSTVDYTTLQTRVTELQGNYQLYTQKRNEAEIADAMDRQNLVNVAVAERPTFSAKPFRPEPLIDLSLGAFTAVFLGICVVFFAEMGRDTVAAPYELEALTRIPVLATVPFIDSSLSGSHWSPPAPRGTGPVRTPASTPEPDDWSGSYGEPEPAGAYAGSAPAFAFEASAPQREEVAAAPAATSPIEIEIEAAATVPQPIVAVQPVAAASLEAVAPQPQLIPLATVAAPVSSLVASVEPVERAFSFAPAPPPQAAPISLHPAAPIAPPSLAASAVALPSPTSASEEPAMFHRSPASSSEPTLLNLSSAPGEIKPILEFDLKPEPRPQDASKPAAPLVTVRDPISRPVLPLRPSQIRRVAFLPDSAVAQATLHPGKSVEAGVEIEHVIGDEIAPMLAEPVAYPPPRRRPSGAHMIASEIPEVVSIGSPQPAAQKPLQPAAALAQPQPPVPVFIPEVRIPEVRIPEVREAGNITPLSEPRHSPSSARLAAIRQEIQGGRPRLSPSQRALHGRPEATRDRNGRIAYVTYTVDRRNHDNQ
jgi:uncharacterized protein involved in exopolysaccharide biosynthesis